MEISSEEADNKYLKQAGETNLTIFLPKSIYHSFLYAYVILLLENTVHINQKLSEWKKRNDYQYCTKDFLASFRNQQAKKHDRSQGLSPTTVQLYISKVRNWQTNFMLS